MNPNSTGVRSPDDIAAVESRVPDPSALCSNTYELLAGGAALDPDAAALSFFMDPGDYERPFVWSHREWLARVTQVANLLRRSGIGRADTVAFVLPNLPETHWVIWGGEAAGRVFALNPLLEPAMLRELLKAVQPRVVVTLAPTAGADLWEKITQIASDVPGLETIFTVSTTPYLRGAQADAARARTRAQQPARAGRADVHDLHVALRSVRRDRLEFEPPAATDVASYFCTGGTTGAPKIAVRTQRTEVANALQIGAMFGPLDGERQTFFCGLPLFHVNGQIGTGLMPWSRGGHVVLGTPQGYRAAGLLPLFWKIAQHYRLLSFSGVPTVYSALLQTPRENVDLSSLRFGICGAAPMPLELIARFESETGIRILEGYGLTEGGCASTLNPPQGMTKPGSIGIRLPWQDIKPVILDGSGAYVRDAAIGETGTFAITGPNLFAGYLDPAHEKGLWIDIPAPAAVATRWLNTGDLGRIDEDGYFWLTGRSKELIIRGGHNIDPKLIEEAVHAHPAVAIAAAVGRPDAHAGEVPVVYVQLRPGRFATSGELLDWARRHIAERAAWPKHVEVLDALPTTAVGKIFKPALAELEVRSVIAMEAKEAGVTLQSCEVVRDPQRGIVARWSAQGEAQELARRLACYTFSVERR